MWEPFTEKARHSIHLGQEEARKLGIKFIGAEHLLLGVLADEDNSSAQILEEHGVTLEKVRKEVSSVRADVVETSRGDMVFSPAFKRVLEAAFEEARELGHNYVGTEHLVMGLVRFAMNNGDGTLARVLNHLQVDLNGLHEDLRKQWAPNAISPPARKTRTKTPTLDSFGRDLTKLAAEGKLDPMVGRHNELERLIMVLSRRTKSNPALVGEPGVGKTAIVEGLAQRIARGEVSEKLADKRVFAIDLAGVVAGTRYRGEFEERLKKIMDEIRNASGEIILFVDELHTLIGAGSAEGSMDAANILKPALSRGELQCIGATTLGEYTKYIEKDPALERRFQPIDVKEPTVDEAIKVLYGIRDRYESYHGVNISNEAIEAAVRLSSRYISDRFLPDKAIDVMDEAASRASLASFLLPNEILELRESLRQLDITKQAALLEQDYERAAALGEEEDRLEARRQALEDEFSIHRAESSDETITVDVEDIAKVVSIWTGVPVEKLGESEMSRLLKIEEHLHERVIGQDEPVAVVSKAIKRARSGFKDPNRPIGSFLFLGPTGVGKTELARTLADFLFDDDNALIRIDMSEFMEKFTVTRLLGSPPGYVGFEEGGQLSDSVRRRPYSVVLFDEIEKAHPDIYNVLLQIMDEGRVTDAQKREVDFRNTVIVLTSNVGFAERDASAAMGFRGNREDSTPQVRYDRMKKKVMEETKRVFKPEFLNRLDATVVFHGLEHEHLIKIVDIMLERVCRELRLSKRDLEVTEAAKNVIVDSCDEPQYGARPLRRAIQSLLEDPLSDEFLMGKFPENSVVIVDAAADDPKKLSFTRKSDEG